jgi:hypothetical protein
MSRRESDRKNVMTTNTNVWYASKCVRPQRLPEILGDRRYRELVMESAAKAARLRELGVVRLWGYDPRNIVAVGNTDDFVSVLNVAVQCFGTDEKNQIVAWVDVRYGVTCFGECSGYDHAAMYKWPVRRFLRAQESGQVEEVEWRELPPAE